MAILLSSIKCVLDTYSVWQEETVVILKRSISMRLLVLLLPLLYPSFLDMVIALNLSFIFMVYIYMIEIHIALPGFSTKIFLFVLS